MSDRTSAYIFGSLFAYLAKQPKTKERDEFALHMFKMTGEYDFSNYQMEANEALMELGLARKGIDPDYPEDGEVWLYGPEKP